MGTGLSLGDRGGREDVLWLGTGLWGGEAERWSNGERYWGISLSLMMGEGKTELVSHNQRRGREAEFIA